MIHEIELIISCAASITFTDPLLKLINTNYFGAFRALSFAKSCSNPNLVFTHVSTAFVHAYLPMGSVIPEEILCCDDPDVIVNELKSKDPEWVVKNTPKILNDLGF